MNGLVTVVSNEQMAARDKPKAPDESQFSIPDSPLGAHIRTVWGRVKIYRQNIDERLLACLRARRAVYSPDELQVLSANGGLNVVYTDLTETKCKAGSAWIRDIVMPAGEQAWGLDPTPIPDLPKPIEAALKKAAGAQIRAEMQQQADAQQPVMTKEEFFLKAADAYDRMRDRLVEEYRKRAKAASDRMEQNIADLMAEGGYEDAMDGFIEDFVTYPLAVLKGPIFEKRREIRWGTNFEAIVEEVIRPAWSRVSPFDFYPAPNLSSTQQGDLIERIRFTREQLQSYVGVPGWNDEQIKTCLVLYHAGRIDNWLWTESERQRLENMTLYNWLSPAGLIDALHYWGSVPGWMLLDWGVDPAEIGDVTVEYEVSAVLIGQFVVHAAVNSHPLKMRPYWTASYDTIPGALWGRSVPDLAAVSQKFCNATASALADNLSMASGPMVWVHANRLADGFNDLGIAPWKVFQLKESEVSTSGTNPGMGFFQPDSNAGELQDLYDKWEMKADDATGIPRYSYGNEHTTGAAATLGGLQTLMDAAGKGLRRATSSIDKAVKGTIYMTWVYEMLYGEDQSAKSDCAVVPRGANALLIKAAAAQNRTQALATTANPIDMQIIGATGRAKLLREAFKAMELPDGIVPDDRTIEMQAEQAAQQPSPAQIETQGTMAEIQANNASKERIAGAHIAAGIAGRRDAAAAPKQAGVAA
jgi:hypothetical protein